MSVQGKWVLVTGAGSGIGFETAAAFARGGANVIIVDINAKSVQDALRQIEGFGTKIQAYVCNVADADAVHDLAEKVNQGIGALDVLVNNAGVFYLGGVTQTPLEMWQRLIDINVMGVVNMTQAFLPAMQANKGNRKIINVASLAGLLPAPNMSAYAACKHAVVGFSEVLAMELSATKSLGNVGVTVVCPGIIYTPLAQNIQAAEHIAPNQLTTMKEYYRKHGCKPQVIAEGIVKNVWKRRPYLWLGPKAVSGYWVSRISRRLARCTSLMAARTNGYLNPEL